MKLFNNAAILLGLATTATATPGPIEWTEPFAEPNPNTCSDASGCTLQVSNIYDHSQSNDNSAEFHQYAAFGFDRLMQS